LGTHFRISTIASPVHTTMYARVRTLQHSSPNCGKNIIDNNKDPVRSNLHHGSSQTQAHPSCTLNPPETTARKDSRRTERDRNLPRRLLYLPQRLMQNPRGRKTSCNMMLIRGRCVFTNLCAVIRLGLPHGVMRRERSVLQQCTYRCDWQRMSL
jgi:hypothetical protein